MHLNALIFILGSLFSLIYVRREKFKHPLLKNIHIAQMSRRVNEHLLVITLCHVQAVISIRFLLVLKVVGKSRHVTRLAFLIVSALPLMAFLFTGLFCPHTSFLEFVNAHCKSILQFSLLVRVIVLQNGAIFNEHFLRLLLLRCKHARDALTIFASYSANIFWLNMMVSRLRKTVLNRFFLLYLLLNRFLRSWLHFPLHFDHLRVAMVLVAHVL